MNDKDREIAMEITMKESIVSTEGELRLRTKHSYKQKIKNNKRKKTNKKSTRREKEETFKGTRTKSFGRSRCNRGKLETLKVQLGTETAHTHR